MIHLILYLLDQCSQE